MNKTVLALALVGALVSGCANQRFTVAGDGSSLSPRVNESQTFFLSGIGQKQSIDAAKACGGADKVDTVDVERGPLDNLLAIVTFGIYTPATARVYCK